jgi:hypothetical protein
LNCTNGHVAKEFKVLLAQVKRINLPMMQVEQLMPNDNNKSFMMNAFKEANKNQADENDKKRKAQSNFAFDDEVFDEFQTAVDIDDFNDDNVFYIDE